MIGYLPKKKKGRALRLPGVEPGSIAWKAIILTVGLQTLVAC